MLKTKGSVGVKKIYLFALVVALVPLILTNYSANSKTYASSTKEPETITIAWLPNNSGDNEKALRDESTSLLSRLPAKKLKTN